MLEYAMRLTYEDADVLNKDGESVVVQTEDKSSLTLYRQGFLDLVVLNGTHEPVKLEEEVGDLGGKHMTSGGRYKAYKETRQQHRN